MANSGENPVTHPPVGTTVKLPVKPVWLKDPTQVSLGLLSLPTSVSLYTNSTPSGSRTCISQEKCKPSTT
ncbi:hypothetical protein Hanom_Chr02g00170741 [Helianthus anomalus]